MNVHVSHPLTRFGQAGETLHDIVSTRRFSPSYLIEGNDDRALADLADLFATCVLATDERELDVLHQRIVGGNHPDVHHVHRDKATVISLEALATQLEQAYLSPRHGSHQIFIIQPADAMDIRAASRYLKVLEEPPATTVFLLLTCHAERLPDTVLSRCRRLRLAPHSIEALVDHLASFPVEEDAALIAQCASGSIHRAERLATLGIVSIAQAISESIARGAPSLMELSDGWWQRLSAAAATLKESGEPPITAAVAQRAVTSELLHVLQVGARDVMRGRSSPVCPLSSVSLALAWHEDLLGLQQATHQNGTPLIMFTETLLRLSQHARA